MAEEISDDRFKGEVMRLLNTVIVKLGDHDKRFESLEQDVSEIKSDLTEVKTDVKDVKTNVKILKGQFTDVVGMVLEDNKRITKLEKDVEDLQSNIH